ncbi:MAG: flavodoxin family protein [Coriobacteriales bacterium]|jgi:hypothetical protein
MPAEESREPDILIVVGSPKENGNSDRLGRQVEAALGVRGKRATYFHLGTYPVAACTDCGACKRSGECAIFGDAWSVLEKHLISADFVFLIAPVYFAGPAAHLKAMLDRCQVFWARKYVLNEEIPPKRPVYLLELGDGGDPFGTEPLEKICTSALNCANLRIDGRIYRFIGSEPDPARIDSIVDGALAAYERGGAEDV